MNVIINPFEVTKSTDFTDQEINDFWVDLTGGPSFNGFFKPLSQMPMIILGGKGSGKTHVIRYFSYNTQRIRYEGNIHKKLTDDGFIGIYFRLGGLNEGRFWGKKIADDIWNNIFTYYMDLSIAQKTLLTLLDVFKDLNLQIQNETEIINEIVNLFDDIEYKDEFTFQSLVSWIKKLRSKVDMEVNNCVFTQKLDIKILINRGKLIYAIPKIIIKYIKELQDIKILYFFDELENASENVQRYLQTLLREKQEPCRIKLSGRLYGIKTYKTLSDGEENIPGSEFEEIELDQLLRENSSSFKDFAVNLCLKRLNNNIRISDKKTLENQFETFGEYSSNTNNDRYLSFTKILKKMTIWINV